MFRNKGQSAMEYLMTYGWALIVIVIVVGALVFLINPSQVGASGCTGFDKLPISNNSLTTAGLKLELVNQTGRALTSVTLDGNATNGGSTSAFTQVSIGAVATNSKVTPTILKTLGAGEATFDMVVTYNDGFDTKKTKGSCKGSVQ